MVAKSAADIARKRIQEIVERVGLADKKLLKRSLRKAYPFAERKRYPYKAWLRECKRAIRGQVIGARKLRQARGPKACGGQRELF